MTQQDTDLIIPKGTLTVIAGCMYAGKTKLLIELASNAAKQGKKVVAYHAGIDTRYAKTAIASHNGETFNSTPLSLSKATIPTNDVDVIIIDEAQFFTDWLVLEVERIRSAGVDVIIGGVDLDFRAEPFALMQRLITNADDRMQLTAKCTICGNPAMYSQRIIDGRLAGKDEPTILVGGVEAYQPRCETCFVKPS